MKKTFFLLLIVALSGCRTVAPEIDTTRDQKHAEDAARGLENTLREKQNVLTPDSRAAVIVGRDTLNDCAETERRLTDRANKCETKLAACVSDLEHSEKNGGGILARLRAEWHALTTGIIMFLIGTFFGRTILNLLWNGLKTLARALLQKAGAGF